MNAVKQFVIGRWKQIAGIGLIWLTLELCVVLFALVWGIAQAID